MNQVWVATYYTNLQKFLKHIKLWKFESRRRLGKKNAAMVDREDKSTQTAEIFVGKISGRKHGIVGNVLDKILRPLSCLCKIYVEMTLMKSFYWHYFCSKVIIIKETFLLAIPSKSESRLLFQRLVTCHKPSKTRARYFDLGLVRNSQMKIQFTCDLVIFWGIIRQHIV